MPPELRGVCPLLQVFDMPAALAFYRDVLGFAVVQTAPPQNAVADDEYGWVWLRHGPGDGTELMLNAAYDPDVRRPPAPDAARLAAHRDTVLFLGCSDVDAAYRHLRARGVRVAEPTTTSYGMRQLTLRDPDGFGVCLQWPAARAAAVEQPPR